MLLVEALKLITMRVSGSCFIRDTRELARSASEALPLDHRLQVLDETIVLELYRRCQSLRLEISRE